MSVEIDDKIAPFVKEIILLDEANAGEHYLPFYADGYPGIMYSETQVPIVLLPINKVLPNFFLYGQTIEPISLKVNGPYKIIVFQLYPFATRLLININPKEVNDACYDLTELKHVDTIKAAQAIDKTDTKGRIKLISNYILDLVRGTAKNIDVTIKLAVSTIINSKGLMPINQLREHLFITERTFERRFAKEVGVTPKQFARIIQFSFSLNQIQESDYTKFTTVAYENGFTDQSHFIKTFKKYTGGTPKEILPKLKAD